MIRLTC